MTDQKDYESFAEAVADIETLPPLMIEKGIVRPSASIRFYTGEKSPQVWLGFSTKEGHQMGTFGADIYRGKTLREAFAKAKAAILAIPERDVAILQDYVRDLAKVVDKGRKNGVPDEYTAPVSLTIKSAYDNLLCKPREDE